MTHSGFYHVCNFVRYQLFTDTQQQNANRKMILALFFLHLMNENKHHRITNKIND